MRRRAAAFLEVLGVYLAGAILNDKIVALLSRRGFISTQNPFDLLTTHASNADLVVASRQLFIALALIYISFFLIIAPLDWVRKRRSAATYGLTRAGHRWSALAVAGIVTAAFTQWPVLVHSIVDAIHPLGPMAPWRQAFFDMSWRRWQFWLFAGVLSYALIPVLEELLFRGYYQRRLAEAWGDGPAILAVACLFTFSHKQYLIGNAYNISMLFSLFIMAVGLGAVYAWTRSLYPSMLAHAVINVPMTVPWQIALLCVFAVVAFICRRKGLEMFRTVFAGRLSIWAMLLAVLMILYALFSNRIPFVAEVAIVLVGLALLLDWFGRRNVAA